MLARFARDLPRWQPDRRRLVTGLLGVSLWLGVGSIGLSGCHQLAQIGIGTTAIADLERDPQLQNDDIYIRGNVENQLGIFGQGAYQVKDNTGSIWVMGKSDLPDLGSNVTVRGTVRAGLTIGDRRLGVTLDEIERW